MATNSFIRLFITAGNLGLTNAVARVQGMAKVSFVSRENP